VSRENRINYTYFPRTQPPPALTDSLVAVFRAHLEDIGTVGLEDGLRSDRVLKEVRPDLIDVGFDVEMGKKETQKIKRPVFFGEHGEPTLRYEVDAYHSDWKCGLEIEAGRAWKGNAVYRDLIQAMVMVQVDVLALAVPNLYKYSAGTSPDYKKAHSVAEALFGHDRVDLPYSLLLIGY
jgi:hypothetical protein